MSSVIKAANLFPFGNLWRFGGDKDVNHVCGGVTSLIVLALILALCLMKAIQVFQMKTVFASSTRTNELVPPMINITTVQNNQQLKPTMFAFSLDTGIQPLAKSTLNHSDILVSAFEYSQSNSNSSTTVTRVPITLEPCTVEHISTVAKASTHFTQWGLNKFTCISLNQSYTVGGSRGFTTSFKALQFNFQCANTACSSATSTNVAFTMLALSTEVNPTNASNPTQIYATPYNVVFQPSTFRQYFMNLDLNTVSTDSSILPWKKVETSQSIRTVDQLSQALFGNTNTRTTVWVQNSGTTNTFERTFLKLDQALAFAGGIFQSLLGVFFFMAGFGKLVYEMQFISEYFRIRQVQSFGFLSFIKISVYQCLGIVNVEPEWQHTKKQIQWQKVVNKLLDVIYLQRRIQFLQRAISVLLDKHHLKGLLLARNPSPEQTDHHYKEHQLRDRLICYLKKKDKSHIQSPFIVPNKQTNIYEIDLGINENKISSKALQHKQNNQKQSATNIHQQCPKEIDQYIEYLSNTTEFQYSQADMQSIFEELVVDIKKLLYESEKRNEGSLSQKIVGKIDPRLVQRIRKIIDEVEKNFRLQTEQIDP